jgi:hypothetical protein
MGEASSIGFSLFDPTQPFPDWDLNINDWLLAYETNPVFMGSG